MILLGDALTVLKTLPVQSARCCITSPPYWQKVDYGVAGQIGLEASPEEYIQRMVEVFAEVHRVLTHDGMLWLNIGSTYASGGRGGGGAYGEIRGNSWAVRLGKKGWRSAPQGWRNKELIPIPWLLCLAMRETGWMLRADCLWVKTNPMMESVTDRPIQAHEYVLQFVKQPRYFFDYEASRVPAKSPPENRDKAAEGYTGDYIGGQRFSRGVRTYGKADGKANMKSILIGPTSGYRGRHRNTFPVWLVRKLLSVSSAPSDTVLDPFCGAGTVGLVAAEQGRNFIGIELNPDSAQEAEARIRAQYPLFCERTTGR